VHGQHVRVQPVVFACIPILPRGPQLRQTGLAQELLAHELEKDGSVTGHRTGAQIDHGLDHWRFFFPILMFFN
jgi:hypothetical protein